MRLENISAKRSKTRFVAIGHSFGGSVLFSAVKNKIYNELIARSLASRRESNKNNPFQDLYILVNPAIENIQYAPLHFYVEEMVTKDKPNIFLSKKFPTLAIFMSEADYATKYLFPTGRFFGTIFENHNTIFRIDRFGKEKGYSQWRMDINTLGHYANFVTHELTSTSSNKKNQDYCSEPEPISEFFPVQRTSAPSYDGENEGWKIPFSASKMVLEHKKNSPAFSPLWVVSVDSDIIGSHNDIFGSQFNCFIEELMVIDKS